MNLVDAASFLAPQTPLDAASILTLFTPVDAASILAFDAAPGALLLTFSGAFGGGDERVSAVLFRRRDERRLFLSPPGGRRPVAVRSLVFSATAARFLSTVDLLIYSPHFFCFA